MGILRYVFVAVLACCAMGSLQAINEAPRHQKKHYVDEKAINVTNDGIVVRTQTGNFTVGVLRSDEKGIYILKKDVSGKAKGCARRPRTIRCRCGREFSGEDAYWNHVESGSCPYYPRR